MILTDEELATSRESIESTSGFDDELLQRSAKFMHRGEFDPVVRNAFILLEERLRKALNEPGKTGTQLANHGFSPKNGPLARYMTTHETEREGLRELYSGAFKYFRNRAAHKHADFSPLEGKSIISFVNLLLTMLSESEGKVNVTPFPENVELAISRMENEFGFDSANRLRGFLAMSEKLGVKPHPNASDKHWIRFDHNALIRKGGWEETKRRKTTIYWLMAGNNSLGIYFQPNNFHDMVLFPDPEIEGLVTHLTRIGFRVINNLSGMGIYFSHNSDDALFDDLSKIVGTIVSWCNPD